MQYKDINNMTAVQFANTVESAVVAQRMITDCVKDAFQDGALEARTDSLLIDGLIELKKRSDKVLLLNNKHCDTHNMMSKRDGGTDATAKARAAYMSANKYQGINILSTQLNRTGLQPEGYHFKVKSTGDQPKIYLAKTQKPTAKSEGKDKSKGTKDASIKGIKSLDDLLDYAVDNYGLEAVVQAVATRAAANMPGRK